jgi:dTDP-4-dehydrorhamnose reductase
MVTLITGGHGKLGKELTKVFPRSIVPSHAELDIGDRVAVSELFRRNSIDLVVHAAALTGIRECEENKEEAWRSNVVGTKNLVEAVLEHKPETYFVYVSTACVFEGDRGMYKEDDIPNPKNYYALTKLLGEFVVQRLPRHLIARTNFVARERWQYPKAFVDRFATYLFAGGVAKGIRDVVDAKLEGVVHIVGDRKMSVYELARMTADDVKPMTLAEYVGPPLTVDMSLDTIRWKRYSITESPVLGLEAGRK